MLVSFIFELFSRYPSGTPSTRYFKFKILLETSNYNMYNICHFRVYRYWQEWLPRVRFDFIKKHIHYLEDHKCVYIPADFDIHTKIM